MNKISFRKVCIKLHLWLGMISGLIIFIVAVTGCIYAFERELKSLFQPYQYVEIKNQPFLSPTQLKEKAIPYTNKLPEDSANVVYGVTYNTANKASMLAYNHHINGYTILLQNPYTGDILSEQVLKNDFFRIVLAGHRNLWLPYQIGHQIVGWAVFTFLIVTITGIILWIPKRWNKKAIKAAFTVKWKTNLFKRNYDLHTVLGIYVAVFAIMIAITGLTWSFSWFGNSYYTLISGGKELNKWSMPVADSTLSATVSNPADILWEDVKDQYPIGKEGSFMFDFPNGKGGVFRTCFNPDEETYYKRHFRFFDPSDLKELEGGGLYGIAYESSTNADKLYRMTYDIHVGAVGGLTGRILVFLASLIIASLPVTGFIIWWKKRKSKKNILVT